MPVTDYEDLSSEELEVLKNFYVKLSSLAEQENELHSSHSIDEASSLHKRKSKSKSTVA